MQPPYGSVIILFAIPLAFLLSVYAILFFLQRMFRYTFQALHNNEPRVIVGGVVARDAGLLGMTTEERRMVIENILKPRIFQGQAVMSQCEIPHGEDKEGSSVWDTARDESIVINDNIILNNEQIVTNEDNLHCCPICLNEFEGTVIIGKYCSHVFHSKCLLDWLQLQDICPCCRVQMITSHQMREASFQIFGEEKTYQIIMRDTISSR